MNLQLTPQPFVRKRSSASACAEDRPQVQRRISKRLGPLLYLFPGYLLLLVAAEVLTLRIAPLAPALGPLLYGVILALLLLHAVLCWDRPFRCLPLMLSLAPLTRQFLFWPAVRDFPELVYCLALGLPLLAMAVAAVSLALPLGGTADLVRAETRWIPVASGEHQGPLKKASAAASLNQRQQEGHFRDTVTAAAETTLCCEPGPRIGSGGSDRFGLVLNRLVVGVRLRPDLLASAHRVVVSIGGFLRTAWSRQRDWHVFQVLQAAWAGRRDLRFTQFLRAAWVGRRDWRVVQQLKSVWSVSLDWCARTVALLRKRFSAFGGVDAAYRFLCVARRRTWELLGRWGRRVQGVVDPLAARVAGWIDDAWPDLGPRLRAVGRSLIRRDRVPWEVVTCGVMLVLLLAVRVGVSVAAAGQAEMSGRLASSAARRALNFGGWGTGFVVAQGGTALQSPEVSREGSVADPPTTPTAGVIAAVPPTAGSTPLVITEDRLPPVIPTPAQLLSVPAATPAPGPVSAPVFPSDCPGGGYENIYPWGVCTWYAKAMRPDLPWFWGDWGMADNWGYSARTCGFVVNTEPAPGAVIVFPPFANGASSRGHVGYVEEVGPDYVLFSECNAGFDSLYAEEPFWWEAGYSCIHRRVPRDRLDPGIEYIHGRAGAEGAGEP